MMHDHNEIDPERKRIQRSRNLAMALVLGGLAVLFFFITMAKFQG